MVVPKSWTVQQLLNPPDIISFEEGQAVRAMTQNMIVDAFQHDPLVCVTYATGKRPDDESGFGPGTYYVAAVLLALAQRGIPCFSGLMIPPGDDWQIYLTKLEGEYSTKILIVLQTEALYGSKPCLIEIDKAQHTKLYIIPVLFTPRLPKPGEQWPKINRTTDARGLIMKMAVKMEFGKLNSIPSPPNTIPSKPEMLNEVINIVENKLRQLGVVLPIGSASERRPVIKEVRETEPADPHVHTGPDEQETVGEVVQNAMSEMPGDPIILNILELVGIQDAITRTVDELRIAEAEQVSELPPLRKLGAAHDTHEKTLCGQRFYCCATTVASTGQVPVRRDDAEFFQRQQQSYAPTDVVDAPAFTYREVE